MALEVDCDECATSPLRNNSIGKIPQQFDFISSPRTKSAQEVSPFKALDLNGLWSSTSHFCYLGVREFAEEE